MTEEEFQRSYSKPIKKLLKVQAQAVEKKYIWLRGIISVAGIFLSINGIKSPIPNKIDEFVIYCLLQISLVFGIFFGLIALYGEVQILDSLQVKIKEYINILLSQDKYESVDFLQGNVNKTYKNCERICLFSFVVALISIVVSTILKGYK